MLGCLRRMSGRMRSGSARYPSPNCARLYTAEDSSGRRVCWGIAEDAAEWLNRGLWVKKCASQWLSKVTLIRKPASVNRNDNHRTWCRLLERGTRRWSLDPIRRSCCCCCVVQFVDYLMKLWVFLILSFCRMWSCRYSMVKSLFSSLFAVERPLTFWR